MNRRERVTAALHRQPTDRVPIYMWFHPATAAHLAQVLEIPAAYVAIIIFLTTSTVFGNVNLAHCPSIAFTAKNELVLLCIQTFPFWSQATAAKIVLL